MIKKSLKTLLRNNKTVFNFFMSFLLHLLCILMFTPLYLEILPGISIGAALMICLAALLLVSTVFSTLIYPIALRRVHESVRGDVLSGCAVRGIKKNWWKTFSATRVIHLPAIAVFLIITLAAAALIYFSANPIVIIIVTAILFFFLLIPWVMFAVVCFASVTSHDNFNDGMKNINKLGRQNYIKIYGVHLLGCIPAFIVGLVYGLYYYAISTENGYTYHFLNLIKREEVLLNSVIALVVLILAICIGLVFALIYTSCIYMEHIQNKQINN